MVEHNYVTILAGGKGTRLWPASLRAKPKQFLDILNIGKTLLQSTVDRFKKIVSIDNIYIVTNKEYQDLIIEQIPEIKRENILCEPFRKDTAPSVSYAAIKISQRDPDANMIVSPSDQLILDEDDFIENCIKALEFSQANNAFVTLGIEPSFPNENYGYIQRNAAEYSPNIYKIKTFTEKPPLDMAQAFVSSGDFLWNTGIFVWKVDSLIRDIQAYLPELYEAFNEYKSWFLDNKESYIIDKVYSLSPNASIDLAVLEKIDHSYIIPCGFRWSDLGTWNSIYDQMEKDYYGNAIHNGSNIVVDNSSKCLISVPKDKLVVVEGLEQYIIVDTDKALLICKRDSEGAIKGYLQDIKKDYGRDSFL